MSSYEDVRKNVKNTNTYTYLLTNYLQKKISFISNTILYKYFQEGKELSFIEIILTKAFTITTRQNYLILNSTKKSATKNAS